MGDATWAVGRVHGGPEVGGLIVRDLWNVDQPDGGGVLVLKHGLNAIWADGSNVWVVGYPGTGAVRYWDGARLIVAPNTASNTLFAVWGDSSTSIWAVGEKGVVLHWNGAACASGS